MRHLLLRLRFWLYWPGLYVYFHGSHRTRVLIMDGANTVLVQDRFSLWFDEGTWTVPGGGVHADESIPVAAARELHEELGISIRPEELELLGEDTIRDRGLSYRAHFLVLRLPRATPFTVQKSELQSLRWFSLDDLPTDLKREARKALQLLADR